MAAKVGIFHETTKLFATFLHICPQLVILEPAAGDPGAVLTAVAAERR